VPEYILSAKLVGVEVGLGGITALKGSSNDELSESHEA
jgi:hypothetical protein